MRKLRNSELNRLSTEEFRSVEKFPIIVALDDVRSMHNVGSVFRTADAFKVQELLLGGITPVPPLPEIEKTALGATESVKWMYVENLLEKIQKLKAEGYRVIGFEHTSKSENILFSSVNKDKVVLIFGNEVKGISENLLKYCDDIIEIPQFGTKHSLNISVSAGIGIWEFAKHFMK